MRTLFLLLLWVIATPIPAAEEKVAADTIFPQKLTAGELKVFCAASVMTNIGRQRQRYCDGFLSGIEEGVRVLGLNSKMEAAPSLCVPADVPAWQMRSTFVKNSAGMQPAKDKPAAMYAIEVLEKSYPCR